MPSTSASGATKRKRPAFSPPRPKVSKAKGNEVSKTSISKSKARPAPSKQHKSCPLTSPTPSESDSTPESEPDSPRRSSTPPFEPDYLLAEVTHNEAAQDDEPIVPLALVHTLLHHHFSDKDKTRISQDAKALIGKYVDTFVREAIARSAFERQEKSAEDGAKASDHRGDDGWLEVEDLERMAPQLILDF
jgi:CENP-S associating Centromere protein X